MRVFVADDHPVYRDGIGAGHQRAPRPRAGRRGQQRPRRPRGDRRSETQRGAARHQDAGSRRPRGAGRRSQGQLGHRGPPALGPPRQRPRLPGGRRGFEGYLSKQAARQEICDGIAAVAGGGTAFAPEVQTGLASELHERERGQQGPVLTSREREVLKLVAAGRSAPEIAERIHLSPATVKSHLQAIYDKLGVAERAAAVAEGMRRGFLGSVSVESRREGSEGLKAALLDGALDCVVAIDDRGRVLEFNPAAEATFGYRADEAIGCELADLVAPPDLRDEYRWELDPRPTERRGRLDRRVELTAMRKDGSTLPVQVAARRVPGVVQPIYAGYIRDVTDVKRTEERALDESRAIADLAQARGELVSQLMLAQELSRQRIAQVLHDDALELLLAAHQDLLEAAPGREGVTRAQHRARWHHQPASGRRWRRCIPLPTSRAICRRRSARLFARAPPAAAFATRSASSRTRPGVEDQLRPLGLP